jgi:hypothetical protein
MHVAEPKQDNSGIPQVRTALPTSGMAPNSHTTHVSMIGDAPWR